MIANETTIYQSSNEVDVSKIVFQSFMFIEHVFMLDLTCILHAFVILN